MPVITGFFFTLLSLNGSKLTWRFSGRGKNEELRNVAFSYYSMRKMFDKINVKAVHTGRKIT